MGMGVDPTSIPKSMTREQLEWWILFGVCVAGKGAKQTEEKVNKFLHDPFVEKPGGSPFQRIETYIQWGMLKRKLKEHRMGQYKRIEKAFRAAVKLDLDQISIDLLETVPGIGPKTARMIILYYDPTADCVPLDTHILKWLREQGVPGVPKSTPPAGNSYRSLENIFRLEAKLRGMTVRELDTQVWKSYARI
jgi:hypothetical protein